MSTVAERTAARRFAAQVVGIEQLLKDHKELLLARSEHPDKQLLDLCTIYLHFSRESEAMAAEFVSTFMEASDELITSEMAVSNNVRRGYIEKQSQLVLRHIAPIASKTDMGVYLKAQVVKAACAVLPKTCYAVAESLATDLLANPRLRGSLVHAAG